MAVVPIVRPAFLLRGRRPWIAAGRIAAGSCRADRCRKLPGCRAAGLPGCRKLPGGRRPWIAAGRPWIAAGRPWIAAGIPEVYFLRNPLPAIGYGLPGCACCREFRADRWTIGRARVYFNCNEKPTAKPQTGKSSWPIKP